MIPGNIKKEHILMAIEYICKNGVPPNRVYKKYFLEYNSKKYPPKYVISIANNYANGEELDPQKFNGGHETNDFLKRLGFKIVNKNIAPPPPPPPPRTEQIKNLISLWDKTERAFFECVSEVMTRKHGKFWMEELEKLHPQLTYDFNECRREGGAGKTKFPSNDLIKHAGASTPFNITRLEWGSFSSIFKEHTEYSRFERQDFLVPVRNKLKHPKLWEELSDEEIALAKKYLLELLDILKSYQDAD